MSPLSPPRAHIIVVGDEIVRARVADRNGHFLARELNLVGFGVARMVFVPDSRETIAGEVSNSLAGGVELMIVTGGLGPTSDDVTREAVADALQLPVVLDPELRRDVRRRAVRLGDVDERMVDRQAMVFTGARWLENDVGVAPGLAARHGGTDIYLLPGPPAELQPMFRRLVLPDLGGRGCPPAKSEVALRIAGIREAAVAEQVERVLGEVPEIAVAYLPAPAVVDVILSAHDDDSAVLEGAVRRVRSAMGIHLVSDDGRTVEEVVSSRLLLRTHQLVTAESCTGGLIAELITSVPGSSRFFAGGVVAYSNGLKQRLLGVPDRLIQAHGAVSEQVARSMALGALDRVGGDWSISVTGIAGPDGGTHEKPVGLVFLGVAGPGGVCTVERHSLGGDRATVRLTSARLALDLLRRQLVAT